MNRDVRERSEPALAEGGLGASRRGFKQSTARLAFGLEMLEPRVLLSGDGVVALATTEVEPVPTEEVPLGIEAPAETSDVVAALDWTGDPFMGTNLQPLQVPEEEEESPDAPERASSSLRALGTNNPQKTPVSSALAWDGGEFYNWRINDVNSGAGVGWDVIEMTPTAGKLKINASSARTFLIEVSSLNLSNTDGPIADFDKAKEYAWTILTTTEGITGFDRSAFQIGDTTFKALNGVSDGVLVVDVANGDHDIVLKYYPSLPRATLVDPPWVEQGPTHLTGNQSTAVTDSDRAIGAVQVVAFHPKNNGVAFIGSVNGGVWLSETLIPDPANLAAPPQWTYRSSGLGSLAIGALAVSPFKADGTEVQPNTPANQLVVFAGTGSFSSAGDAGGPAAGLFRSTDGGQNWVEVGESLLQSQRFSAILPTAHPGLVFAGNDYGLYRSTDGGVNWQSVSDRAMANANPLPLMDVQDIVVDPTSAFANGSTRFYVSVMDRIGTAGIYRLELSTPGDFATFLATSFWNVAWERIDSGLPLDFDADGRVGEADEDANGDRLLTAGEDTDGDGRLDRGESLANAARIRLGIGSSGILYAAVIVQSPVKTLGGVFQSFDSGDSWGSLGTPPSTNPTGQGDRHFGLAVGSGGQVYVGGTFDAASVSGSFLGVAFRWDPAPVSNWTQITTRDELPAEPYQTAPHPDVRNLVLVPGAAGLDLYAPTDGGLYRLPSANVPITAPTAGIEWQFLGEGMNITEISHSVAYDHVTDLILAGTQDNGVIRQKSPNSSEWETITGGDGNFVGVGYLPATGNSLQYFMSNGLTWFYRQENAAAGPVGPASDPVYLGTADPSTFATPVAQIADHYQSLDNVSTIGRVSTDLGSINSSLYYSLPIAVHPVDGSRMMVGRVHLYRSTDRGVTAAPVPDGSGLGSRVGALAYGHTDPAAYDVTYVARGAAIWGSLDGTNFTGTGAMDGAVQDIVIDPGDPAVAFAVTSTSLYRIAFDAARTSLVATKIEWRDNKPGVLRSVTAVEVDGRLHVLVGGFGGVYRLDIINRAAFVPTDVVELQKLGSEMPELLVTDIVYDKVDDVLVAGTLGRGAWKLNGAADALRGMQTLFIETGDSGDDIRIYTQGGGLLQVEFDQNTAADTDGVSYWGAGEEPETAKLRDIVIYSGAGDDRLTVVSDVDFPIGVPITWYAGEIIETTGDRLEFDGTTYESVRNPFFGSTYVFGQELVIAYEIENDPTQPDANHTEFVPFLEGTGAGSEDIFDIFGSSMGEAGGMPLLGDGIFGSFLGNGYAQPELVGDPVGIGVQAPRVRTAPVDLYPSLLHRLLEDGTGFYLSDIGTRYATAAELAEVLDAMDTIPGNATVTQNADGVTGRILLGDPADPARAFKRTLILELPLHERLLGGGVTLDGTLKFAVDFELMMELGIDSSGFYLATDATTRPEIRVGNFRLEGAVNASARFGFLALELTGGTLTTDSDVALSIDLMEPDNPFGDAPDGKLRAYEVATNPLGLFDVQLSGDPNQPDLTLKGTFEVAPLAPGGKPMFELGGVKVDVVWDDVTDPLSVSVKADPTTPAAEVLFRFLNLDGNGMTGELNRLLDFFSAVKGLDFMDIELPFTGGVTAGEAIDFAQGLKNQVFGVLFDVCLSASTGLGDPDSDILLGRLSADATFTLYLGDAAGVTVTVSAASTNAGADINNSLSDLVRDLNEALVTAGLDDEVAAKLEGGQIEFCLREMQDFRIDGLATDPIFVEVGFSPGQVGVQVPKFGSLQELVAALEAQLRAALGDEEFELAVGYDSAAQEFSFSFYFTDTLLSKTVSFTYDPNLGLGDIADLSASGSFTLEATVNFGSEAAPVTLGVQLGALASPRLTGSATIPAPSNGRLSADAEFDLVLNYGDVTGGGAQNGRIHLKLPQVETDANTSIDELLGDLNRMLERDLETGIARTSVTIGGRTVLLKDIVKFAAAGTTLAMEVIGEDADGDGVLDEGEDADGDTVLDVPNLSLITSIDLEADLDNPIVSELGLVPGTPVRAAIKGITLKNANLSGTLSLTGSGLGAGAKFSVFEINTSGGTVEASGTATFSLANPEDATKPVNLREALLDLDNLTTYLRPGFAVEGEFDLKLNNLVLTPDIDLTDSNDSIFGEGAYIEIWIPDLNDLHYNENAYSITDSSTDNDSGVFVTYPSIGPLGNFSCLTLAAIISAADQLVDDLETIEGLSFLDHDLPLINISVGDLLDTAGDLARFFADLATGNVETINTLEADLKAFFGLPANSTLIDLSVQDATPAGTDGGSAGNNASTRFNPHGQNNALLITAKAKGEDWNGYEFEFSDPGTYAADQDIAEVTYDKAGKRIAVSFNATVTKASTMKAALEARIGSDWTITYDHTAQGDPAPTPPTPEGDGAITVTALKFSIQYALAYGSFESFQFNIDELLESMSSADSAALQALLGGVGSLVDVEGTADLNVTASAELRLDFGIDVSNPCNWLPFLYDSTGITLEAAVRGTNLNFAASMGGLGIFVKDGTATLDRDGDPDTVGEGEDAAFQVDIEMGTDQRYYFREGIGALTSNVEVSLEGAVSVDLPLYFPTESFPLGGTDRDTNNDGNPDNNLHIEILCLDDFLNAVKVDGGAKISAACLVIQAPDLNDLFGQFNPCDLVTNAPLLLDGLDILLGAIQNALDSEVLNRRLPLVGDQLSKAANVIGNFRAGLLAEMRAKLAEVGGDPLNLVKLAIWNVLGGPGLDILVDENGDKLGSYEEIDIECMADRFEFNLHLGQSIELVDTTSNPIGFDIGIPGFELAVEANVVVEIGWSFDLSFAISAADGFYFITDGDDPELLLEFKVTLPSFSFGGELFFLRLDVADEADGKDLTGKPRNPTLFSGGFSIDILDPIGSGKLTVGDILASGLDEIVDADLSATAQVHLDIIVSFDGSAVVPRLLGEFDLVWTWSIGNPDGSLEEFGFRNWSLDLGSFISDFLKPILEKIQIVTKPLDPLIEVLTAPLPVLSDLAGRDYTLVDLAERFGLLDPGTAKFLDFVLAIGDLVNDVSITNDGSLLIPIGSFNLDIGANGEIGRDPFDVELAPVDLSDATTDVNAKTFVGTLEDGGFSFPFLKISELVKLFLGQPISLVEVKLPTLQFTASFEGQIPIFPPLYVIFGGSIGATIDLTFGFDTFGLQKYASSTQKDLADLLEGFYVKDRNDDGSEITEVLLQGGLTAGAELNVLVAEAGVQGGIFTDILFDLRDPNEDGRVRVSEILANIKEGPLCVFDVSGRVYAALEAFLEIHTFIFGDIEKTWRFAEITLLEFEVSCPQPVLASLNEGTGELLLHIGENAAKREHGDIEDGNEHFIVQSIGGSPSSADGETVEVSFGGITQSYAKVKSIKALAGKGNDTVDLRGVLAPAEVRGGDGNDALYAGKGEGSVYYGDAGDDTITAQEAEDGFEGVADTFYGGTGNDTLTGRELGDTLYGEDGNDTVNGDDGDDVLEGGNGNDTLLGSYGNDILEGNSGADTLDGGDGDDVLFGDDGSVTLGSNNLLDATDRATGTGGSGDDHVVGGPGNDKLIGGAGDDLAEGGAGTDVLLGDEGAILSPLTVEDVVGSGNDVLAGDGGTDTLFGAGGNDNLFGGAYLTSGSTEVVEADGADFLDGGDGDDTVFADDAHSSQSTTFAGAGVGDFVWFDLDRDGVQDSNETGVAGVMVKLYQTDGTSNTLIGTKITDAAGAFLFTGLIEADYYLQFTAPADHSFVTAGAGTDSALDSDADTSGKTGTFHVGAGQQDRSWDAGVKSDLLAVSIDNVTVSEGDLGQTDAVFTVTLNAPSADIVTVGYRTEPGAGSTGAARFLDYGSVDYTLVFEPGVTIREIRVPIKGDVIDEPNETFTVRLRDAFALTTPIEIAAEAGLGTIVDDDAAPSISVGDASVLEPNPADADAILSFPVTLSNPSWQDLKIDYFTAQIINADGSLAIDAAIAGRDYENTFDLKPTLFTIAAGAMSATIQVKIDGDLLDEYDERFALAIRLNAATASTAATVADDTATGTILDDDAMPYVVIDDGDADPSSTRKNQAEGAAGATPLEFTLKLSAVSGRALTVDWSTNPGTAVSSPSSLADFIEAFGTVEFLAGETEKTIAVEIVGDTVDEGQDTVRGGEKFFVNLVAAQHALLGVDDDHVNHAVVTIVDDDTEAPATPWHIQFSSAAYTVNESADVATITLVRAGGSVDAIAVYWTIGGVATIGKATAGSDYLGIWERGASGKRPTVRFADGQTLLTFDIDIIQDGIFEGDETIDLYLANPTGGPSEGATTHAVLTIVEDDPLPEISINDVSIVEPSSGTRAAQFTVTATGESAVPIQVFWSTADGPAVEPMTAMLVTAGGMTHVVVDGVGLRLTGNDPAKANDDYQPAAGGFVIPAFSGSWSDNAVSNVVVNIEEDAAVENLEEFVVKLSLSDPSTAELVDSQGVGTIDDVDTASLTGRVFFDADGDGRFDEGVDYWLANLDVQLSDGSTILGTDATDASGVYTFTEDIGEYTITVLASDPDFPVGALASLGSIPMTFAFTTTALTAPDIGLTVAAAGVLPGANIGNGSSFSNDTAYGGGGNDTVDGGQGDDWLVGGHWLGPGCAGEGDPYDAALIEETDGSGFRTRIYVNPANINANLSVRGRVWIETGVDNQDLTGEAGKADILVNLFDENWSLIATTYTDSVGAYGFEKLAPCQYYVQFQAPAGWQFAQANRGTGTSPDNVDSDADPVTGLTAAYDLSGGAVTTASQNVDAGLIAIPPGGSGPWSIQFGSLTYSARETDGAVAITITRTPGSIEAVGVYRVLDGTATDGEDYRSLVGTVRFGEGELEKVFVVPILADDLVEGYETVLLQLSDPTGGPVTGNLAQSTLLIFDNPSPDDDTVVGGEGNDVLLGDFGYFSAGAAVLLGGLGNDSLFGDGGDDQLYGEGGNDLLEGGTGNDTLTGGGENDTYRADGDLAQGTDRIIEERSPFGGNDTIDLSSTSTRSITLDLRVASPQQVTTRTVGGTTTVLLELTIPAEVIENITGGALGDILTGNSLDNILIGGGGDDVLEGLEGDDDLDGGAGGDTYRYGAGLDLGHDDIFEASNSDSDLLDFTAATVDLTIDLATNVSQTVSSALSLTINTGSAGTTVARFGATLVLYNPFTGEVVTSTVSTGIENVYGGSGRDVLLGNTRDNVIWGGAGNDEFDGGTSGYDVLKEDRVGDWTLVAVSADTGELRLGLETNTFALGSFDEISLVGSETDNVLDASSFSGFVRLEGRGGNDTLTGGSGTNILSGGPGSDTIDGSRGVDTLIEDVSGEVTLTNSGLTVGTETDTFLGTIEFAEIIGSTGPDRIDASAYTGGATLSGGAGDDTVIGTVGADNISGGPGNDLLRGGLGDDTYLFAADELLFDVGGTPPIGDRILDLGGIDTIDLSATLALGAELDLARIDFQEVNENLLLALLDANANGLGDEIENIIGTQQDDVLLGNALANEIDGQEGSDSITGRGAADTLRGGGGTNDLGPAFEDRFLESRDTASLVLTDTAFLPDGDVLEGFEAATLAGGPSANAIDASAFSGKVTLLGLGGGDTLLGGAGDDVLEGGAGDDVLRGRGGNDTYRFAADTLLGSDRLEEETGAGTDTLDFSSTLFAGVTVALDAPLGTARPLNANLSLTFTDFDADGQGGEFENVVGGTAADNLTGNALANTLEGGAGDDVLIGGGANDLLIGGDGGDSYRFTIATLSSLGSDTILESVGESGSDTLDFSASSLGVTLDLGLGSAQTVSSGRLTLILVRPHALENFIGGSGADKVAGNSLANRLEGRGGDDQLSGGMGDDLYVFDADTAIGSDTLGSDPLDRDGDGALDDWADEYPDDEGGIDTLDFSTTSAGLTVSLVSTGLQSVNGNLSLTLNSGQSFENVIGGSGADSLTGNELPNTLDGGAGSDKLYGRNGNDVLIGGSGNDTEIKGGNGDDRLEGGAGDDTMEGGQGNDAYLFDLGGASGSDGVTELAGEGNDTLDFYATLSARVVASLASTAAQLVHANLTLTLNATDRIENLIGGGGDDDLTGNALDNILGGGGGADVLRGRGGNDHLDGGPGDDTYDFGAAWGNDTVEEAAGGGVDILDFTSVATSVAVNLGFALAVSSDAGAAIYTVGHAGTEIETIRTGAGSDLFTVQPSLTTAYTLRAGAGADTLSYDALGAATTRLPGSISSEGYQTVTHDGFETVTILNAPAALTLFQMGELP